MIFEKFFSEKKKTTVKLLWDDQFNNTIDFNEIKFCFLYFHTQNNNYGNWEFLAINYYNYTELKTDYDHWYHYWAYISKYKTVDNCSFSYQTAYATLNLSSDRIFNT